MKPIVGTRKEEEEEDAAEEEARDLEDVAVAVVAAVDDSVAVVAVGDSAVGVVAEEGGWLMPQRSLILRSR